MSAPAPDIRWTWRLLMEQRVGLICPQGCLDQSSNRCAIQHCSLKFTSTSTAPYAGLMELILLPTPSTKLFLRGVNNIESPYR